MWDDVVSKLLPGIVDVLNQYSRGVVIAAVVSVAIYFLLEWTIGPFLLLPGLKRLAPVVRATRPLVAFLLSGGALFHLHTTGRVDFGAGPGGWELAFIYAAVGGAGVPFLADFIERHAPHLTVAGVAEAVKNRADAAQAGPGGDGGAGA
jgi:hypothetical protein